MRLTGQNGWTEVAGCPQYTNDDFPLAMQMEQDLLNKIRSSTPSSRPEASASSWSTPTRTRWPNSRTDYEGRDRRRSGGHAADATRRFEGGACDRPFGQRPFDMGYKVMYALKAVKDGKARRPIRPIPGSTSARRRMSTPASAAGSELKSIAAKEREASLRGWPLFLRRINGIVIARG